MTEPDSQQADRSGRAAMFAFASRGPGDGPRVGCFQTPHGPVDTPAFMPVGTQATVKGLTAEQVATTGAQVVLANTYHLVVRPGAEVIERLGGLHRVMGWDRAILTDSGGFQVFSLTAIRQVSDEGVRFANHVDGAELMLTPASAIEAQNRLGADLIMCLDECVGAQADYETSRSAVERTTRWARACKAAHRREDQALFGIVQGQLFADLRRQSVEELGELDFPGYAIGGLSVGEGHERMMETLGPTAAALPAGRPRYLMGVGEPADLLGAIGRGVDMFDCVLPTRNGRNGFAFTADGPLKLRNERHRLDDRPVEDECDCYCCRRMSRGVLRHLVMSGEMLGASMLSLHNLRFFGRLMEQARTAIGAGRFEAFAADWLARYRPGGETDKDS
ncbi:MAG: Queuine tRNA-ribosyltransferase [Phycisphaerae bacterium]|nr:Queuine tRNA-ribosyltransferase [Phycisphaerae bacterium]